MVYKQTDIISPSKLWDAEGYKPDWHRKRMGKFLSYFRPYHLDSTMYNFDEIIEFFRKERAIRWLINKGFIERV